MKKVILVLMLMIVPAVKAEVYNPHEQPKHEILAATLLLEARGEGPEGMRAVANVIINRSNMSGKSIKQVCLEPKQFSCWNKPLNKELIVRLFYTPEGKWALKFSRQATLGYPVGNNVGKADHYHAKYVRPKWARNMTLVAIIGNHLFYQSK